jgi:hypothetical protein
MKAQIFKLLLTAVTFTCFEIAAVAQPSWSVSPNLYDYSMTVTGKIVIDGAVSVDQNDIIAAFIDEKCCGVVNVKYQSTMKDYFVFLMIYSNNPTGSISFKVFDASENKEYDVGSTISFSINGIVGSVRSPHEFSVVTKIYEAKFLTFTIPDQEGYTSIGTNMISLTQKVTGDLGYIAPVFTLSDGAKAYVDDALQVSGTSVNDFRHSVQYKIVPLVGAPVYYWVSISKGADTSTKIMLSSTTVAENKDSVLVGELSAESDYLGNSYTFSLVNITGADNQIFYLLGDKLYVKKALNFEVKPQYKVNIQVANNNGISKQTTFDISVSDQNDPPTGISLSAGTISESAVVGKMVARLSVEDEDVGDVHIFSLKTGNGINDEGNFLFTIKGDSLVLKEKISKIGKDKFKILVAVTDRSGASFSKEWSFQVVDINNPPQFTSKPVAFAVQNQVYVYPVQVEDKEGDKLVISFEGLPDWLTFNVNNGLLSGVPKNKDVGDHKFVIKVSDGSKETLQTISVSVLNINDAPEIKQIPGTQYFYTGKENTITVDGFITDPDADDKLTFQLSMENNSALPGWLIFNPATLSVSGNPPGDERGVYNLKLTATDSGGLKEYVVFKLEVSFPTAIGDQNRNMIFRLYPNPVQNHLYVNVPDGNGIAEISIINITGKVIKTVQVSPGVENILSVKEFESGIYFVRLRQGKSEQIKKIIKE